MYRSRVASPNELHDDPDPMDLLDLEHVSSAPAKVLSDLFGPSQGIKPMHPIIEAVVALGGHTYTSQWVALHSMTEICLNSPG